MQNLPSRKELALLALLAAIGTVIVALSPQRDLGLLFCGGSLTFVASLLGLRRNLLRAEAVLAEQADEPSRDQAD